MRNRILVPLLVLVLAVGLGTVAWAAFWRSGSDGTMNVIAPTAPQVAAAEAARKVPGSQTRDVTLTAAPTTVDLGGRTVQTWAFNGEVPGPNIQAAPGDVIRARVVNHLPQPLTVHWHGIRLRNDMDGVPDVTQKAIKPGASFVYEFTAPEPGTYFYHPHTGTQLDRGLYGALIVDAPAQNAGKDIPLILDDWIDGTGKTPDDVLRSLKHGGAQMSGMDMGSGPSTGSGSDSGSDMSGMDMGSGSDSGMSGMDMGSSSSGNATSPLGPDVSDVAYPEYLINGRTTRAPREYSVRPGEVVRLRLINAASATPFRVAVGGSQMTVVATDGYPVEPVRTDSLLIAMGERYDVEVTVPDAAVVPVVASAEGQGKGALAVLRTGPGAIPTGDVHPKELEGSLLALDQLHATSGDTLAARTPDRTYQVQLTGDMMSYRWGVKGTTTNGVSLPVRMGDRVRLVITNNTTMWHPIHLHGHTFQVVTKSGDGPRKDTVIVGPKSQVTVEFDADNPGRWMLHCHNIYHAEAGMMTTLNYVS